MDKKFLLVVAGALTIGLLTGYFVNGAFTTSSETADNHQHEEGTYYTCSMHPQINQPEPGSCPICGMALISAATTAATDDQSAVVALSASAQEMAQIQTVILGATTDAQSTEELSAEVQVHSDLTYPVFCL